MLTCVVVSIHDKLDNQFYSIYCTAIDRDRYLLIENYCCLKLLFL
jgi:hypothetical protein